MEITINKTKLAEIILENKEKIGSPDWGVYVNLDGVIDCRSNAHPNDEWHEIVNLYSFWNDDETLNSDPDELGDWLKSDGIPHFDPLLIDVVYE